MSGSTMNSQGPRLVVEGMFSLLTSVAFSFFTYFSNSSRGVIHDLDWWPNEEGQGSCWYHGWSPWRTCQVSVMGRGSTLEPPCRFSFFQNASNQNQTFQFHFCTCTVLAIWLICIRTGKSFEQGRRKITFAQFLTSNHQTVPVRLTEVFFARAMHSTSVIR